MQNRSIFLSVFAALIVIVLGHHPSSSDRLQIDLGYEIHQGQFNVSSPFPNSLFSLRTQNSELITSSPQASTTTSQTSATPLLQLESYDLHLPRPHQQNAKSSTMDPTLRLVQMPFRLGALLRTNGWSKVLDPSISRLGIRFRISLRLHLPCLARMKIVFSWMFWYRKVSMMMI